MKLSLRTVEDRTEALALGALVERAVGDSSPTSDEAAPAQGSGRAFLERSFERPETLVLVAEGEGFDEPPALCVTAPFEHPFSGERRPMVIALWVQDALRHRGLARALIDEASRLLAARGFAELVGRVGHNDDALISMGERWGFVRSWELVQR